MHRLEIVTFVANLVAISSLAFASQNGVNVRIQDSRNDSSMSISALNNINSLDLATDELTNLTLQNQTHDDSESTNNFQVSSLKRGVGSPGVMVDRQNKHADSENKDMSTDITTEINLPTNRTDAQKGRLPLHRNVKSSLLNNATSNAKTKTRKAREKAHVDKSSLSQMIVNLLGQLEKLDLKRLMFGGDDSTSSSSSSSPTYSSLLSSDNLAGIQQRLFNLARKSSAIYNVDQSISNITSAHPKDNSTTKNVRQRQHHQHSGNSRTKSVNTLLADAGNLFSVTNQLVKLARHQIGGDMFGWPSMLSSNNHMLHGADFTSASIKSDLFWTVVPAVIVIGAGVILVPLIAAKLVSGMLSQGTFTVSAGKRRRRRDVSQESSGTFVADDGLLSLLNIHQIMEDGSTLLAELGKFNSIMENAKKNINKLSKKT